MPVHHSNEIAQTQARYGTRPANFWLHGAFLKNGEARMSKSDGAFVRLQSLVEQGIDPLTFRYLCLSTHYRGQLNFTQDALGAATNGLARMRTMAHRLGAPGQPDAAYLARFHAELDKDLNFPRALALAWDMLKSPLPDACKKATILRFDEAFGLRLAQWEPSASGIPPALLELMTERALARKERRWLDADRLRARARESGYELDDTAQGQQACKI